MPPSDLVGRWVLERRLVDYALGRHGRVVGHLDLDLDVERGGQIVHWREVGRLSWNGASYPVSRELGIVPAEGGGGWTVCFSDGRPFHPWTPGVVVEHPCRADRYRGLIVVDAGRTRLRTLWDVVGPGKRARIVTRYRRQATPPGADGARCKAGLRGPRENRAAISWGAGRRP